MKIYNLLQLEVFLFLSLKIEVFKIWNVAFKRGIFIISFYIFLYFNSLIFLLLILNFSFNKGKLSCIYLIQVISH